MAQRAFGTLFMLLAHEKWHKYKGNTWKVLGVKIFWVQTVWGAKKVRVENFGVKKV